MKPAYSNLTLSTGVHVAGVIEVKIVPRDWLLQDPVVDFLTGKVTTPLQLVAGKSFITLSFTPDSYEFDEKPKSAKSGSFFEISAGGSLNHLDPSTQQVLETLRYHEVVALVKDKKLKTKVAGGKEAAMVLQWGHRQNPSHGGTQLVTVDLFMESEDPAPFYEA